MRGASLNHTYRLIWNRVSGAWSVVSEIASSQGFCKALCLIVLSGSARAEVSGGVVTAGAGTISQHGSLTTVTQSSQILNLDWLKFNIEKGQTVQFVQPSSTALAINQILDSNGTRILGHLLANGQVWLINPNGVFFGRGAEVNVGALLASTLNPLSAAGDNIQTFGQGGKGNIVNQGKISVAKDGYVAFVANKVSNQGSIYANHGFVSLSGGSQVTLTFADNQLYKVNVDQSTLNNLAENKQLIQADAGTVVLSAGAKQSVLKSLVNNQGIIEARTIENKAGKIYLLAGESAGATNVSGTLDASAASGDGGFIETSGASVNVSNRASITTIATNGTTGTWLIDPLNFTIAASGGNITGTAVSQALANNDVKIQTADSSSGCQNLAGCTSGTSGQGDIIVNDKISWSANTTLTLSAYRNIDINRSISASGETGKLSLEYGQGSVDGMINGAVANYEVNARVDLHSGDNFFTKLGSEGQTVGYTVITSLGEAGSSTATDLQGISGNVSGHYVLGADIDASSTANWNCQNGICSGFDPIIGNGSESYGYFSGVFDGLGHVIYNLHSHFENYWDVGLFAGTTSNALIQNVGLVNADIGGFGNVGGLVGFNQGNISGSFVSGNISAGYGYVGGLVGTNAGGTISDSYATGNVSGAYAVGGLVGQNYTVQWDEGESAYFIAGTIKNSYASTENTLVCGSGCEYVEAGNKDYPGGLVGINTSEYPTTDSGIVENSYYNSDLESHDNGAGTGLNTSQMQSLASFTGWKIDANGGSGNTWRIYAGDSMPLLRSFLSYAYLETVTTTFNGSVQNAQSAVSALDANHVFGQPASGQAVGLYQNGAYYSDQTGYDFAGGQLAIVAKDTAVKQTPDVTNPVTTLQNPLTPPVTVQSPNIPVQQIDLNIQPSAGNDADDDSLYDVIQTFGCSA